MSIEGIRCALPGCGSYDKEQTTASLVARVMVVFLGAGIATVGILAFFIPQLHALGTIGSGVLIGGGALFALVAVCLKYVKGEETAAKDEVDQTFNENPSAQKDSPSFTSDKKELSAQQLRIMQQHPAIRLITVDIELYEKAIPAFNQYTQDEAIQKKLQNNDFLKVCYVTCNDFGMKNGLGRLELHKFLTYLVLTGRISGFSYWTTDFSVALVDDPSIKCTYTKESLAKVDEGLEKIALPKKEDFPQKQQEKIGKALDQIYKAHYWRLVEPKTVTTAIDFGSTFNYATEEDVACLDELVRKGAIKAWHRADRTNDICAKLADDDEASYAVYKEHKWRDAAVIAQIDMIIELMPKIEEFPKEQHEKMAYVLPRIQKAYIERELQKIPSWQALVWSRNTQFDEKTLDYLVLDKTIHSWKIDRTSNYVIKLRELDTTDKIDALPWRTKDVIENEKKGSK